MSYAGLAMKTKKDGVYLVYTSCRDAMKGKPETERVISKFNDAMVYLRVKLSAGAKCRFSYSVDGIQFSEIDEVFQAEAGRWIGAKIGLFCTRTGQVNDAGFADIDWFRVEPLQ
ncbi:MAG: glycosyl hydrolase 43 family protein, partial [Sediminibacterium sp.]|nr:glycosyl hydrolase 43 family protein [Sediminibacterium sp.]